MQLSKALNKRNEVANFLHMKQIFISTTNRWVFDQHLSITVWRLQWCQSQKTSRSSRRRCELRRLLPSPYIINPSHITWWGIQTNLVYLYLCSFICRSLTGLRGDTELLKGKGGEVKGGQICWAGSFHWEVKAIPAVKNERKKVRVQPIFLQIVFHFILGLLV